MGIGFFGAAGELTGFCTLVQTDGVRFLIDCGMFQGSQAVPVKARIYTLGGLSTHADQATLLSWLRGFRQAPGNTFVVHGESSVSASFPKALQEQLGWSEVQLPKPGEYFTLSH